jgi:arsenite methyltransferase
MLAACSGTIRMSWQRFRLNPPRLLPGSEIPIASGPSNRARLLDIGCGAGMDLLLAARRACASGHAVGIDMTPSMLELAKRAALKAGLWANVEVRRGLAEELPVETESVDVVISNGVFHLLPDKHRALREAYRVLRPGGRLYLADVVVQRELSLAARSDVTSGRLE